jgi:thioredoxin 1
MQKKKLIVGILVSLVVVTTVLGVKVYKDKEEETQTAQKDGVEGIDVLCDGECDLVELKSEKKPILLDFTASWCIPCKTFNPILEQTKKDLGDKVIIKIIDVDKYPEVSAKYPIRAIPTQILINADGTPFEPTEDFKIYGFLGYSPDGDKGGEGLTVHEGAMSQEDLTRLLGSMSGNSKTEVKE